MIKWLRSVATWGQGESATHDYGPGHRGWGHDYTFTPATDERPAEMSGWGDGIQEGDYLLIEQRGSPDGRTRYRVTTIRYCADPSDMWFATVEFAPRPIRSMSHDHS